MSGLTLIIPGLRWPAQALFDLTFDLGLPGLCRLFSIGRWRDEPPSDPLERAACNGIDSGAAALRLLGLGGDPGTKPWLCIDPVGIDLRERGIQLSAGANLALSAEQALRLAEQLAPEFAIFGELQVATPESWHLRLNESAPNPELAPLHKIQGKGETATLLSPVPAWRLALNAAQMILHQQGIARINSVWPWGAGRLPASMVSAHCAMYTDDPVLRGWSVHCNVSAHALPRVFADLPKGDAVVVLDSLAAPERDADALAWRAALERLDTEWLQALAASGRAANLIFPGAATPRHLQVPGDSIWRTLRRSWPRRIDQKALLGRLAA